MIDDLLTMSEIIQCVADMRTQDRQHEIRLLQKLPRSLLLLPASQVLSTGILLAYLCFLCEPAQFLRFLFH